MDKKHLINNQIRANKIMLLGEDGAKIGEYTFHKALELALEQELDLVQVGENPREQTAICKMFNYGSFMYHENKKKSKQDFENRRQEIKTMNIAHGIGEKDYEIKMKKIREFIDESRKVKVIIKFGSAREASNRDLSQSFIKRIVSSVEEFSSLENNISSQGFREYNFMIKPKRVQAVNKKEDGKVEEVVGNAIEKSSGNTYIPKPRRLK